jgi:hypothetical protein
MKRGQTDRQAMVPIEVQAAPSVQPTKFLVAQRLAKQLLADEANAVTDDARIVAAFQRFLDLTEGVAHWEGEAPSEPKPSRIRNSRLAQRLALPTRNALAIATRRELQSYSWSPQSEPYFLEVLQAEANRTQRRQRGMYFTPRPVIDCLLHRIETLVPNGPLRIVDPACGAGVFLLAAKELAKRRPGSSLVGFDVSPAAIEVTRLLLQRGAGVPPAVNINLQCVNPLVEGEALASDILHPESTLVLLGNPPYANYGRLNRGTWINRLLADYRQGVAEQKLNLTDDFIKFLRWGQHWIDRAERGVLAMITSRTYLGGVTHRGMRRSLAESFPRIEIVDLHGDGEPGDENVFAIRRGVALGVFHKQSEAGESSPHIAYASLRGSRAKKLVVLNKSQFVPSHTFALASPDWLFLPTSHAAAPMGDEYLSWPRLDEIFTEFISGVQTKNDALFVDFDRDVLAERMREHLEQTESKDLHFDAACLRPYVVGPLDRRWIYYEPRLLGRARWSVMRQMLSGENLALVFMRQSSHPSIYDHALVVDSLASDRVFYSRRGAPFVAPLWRFEANQAPMANFRADWVERCRQQCPNATEPDLFAYLYAVLWSPAYRERYLSQLQRDFPRIPWPRDEMAFARWVALGKQLLPLHLGRTSAGEIETVGPWETATVERGYPKLERGIVWINRQSGFRLTDEAAWSFTIGGYQVLRRWLSVRRGRKLSPHDLQHVAQIVTLTQESQRLRQEISWE